MVGVLSVLTEGIPILLILVIIMGVSLLINGNTLVNIHRLVFIDTSIILIITALNRGIHGIRSLLFVELLLGLLKFGYILFYLRFYTGNILISLRKYIRDLVLLLKSWVSIFEGSSIIIVKFCFYYF